jgi:hypothetical protein
MTVEIWGTFSVRDHLLDRAFIADVLLYDRLVIPTQPEGNDPKDWPAEWDLFRQKRLLNVLGELAIPIPWTPDRRKEWQRRFDDVHREERSRARAQAVTFVAGDVATARASDSLPYQVTRILLADYANLDVDDRLFRRLRATGKARPGSEIEAVAAYPSFDAFNKDVPIDEGDDSPETDAPSKTTMLPPTAIFGWNFFVPESAAKGEAEDLKLLKIAVGLAQRTEFIELRGEFYNWLSDISQGRIPPAEARADMEKRIAEFQKLMAAQEWKGMARRAIKVADAFTGGVGLINTIVGAGGAVFFGLADIVADKHLKIQPPPPRLKVAAMFHEAQTRLGWKPLQA